VIDDFIPQRKHLRANGYDNCSPLGAVNFRIFKELACVILVRYPSGPYESPRMYLASVPHPERCNK
jgi:hypothetical protein